MILLLCRESVQVIKNSMMSGPLPYNFKNCIAVKDYRQLLDDVLEVMA